MNNSTQYLRYSRRPERGVTSLFAVIFAATLLTIVVVSFTVMMIREQTRSSDDELSRSAYDSALAGVEDAKRVVRLAQQPTGAGDVARNAINSNQCDTIARAGVAGVVGSETPIQSTSESGGGELNQAYTCVKIQLDSNDVTMRNLIPMQSRVTSLRSKGEFNRVKIEWHSASGVDVENPCSEGFYMPLCSLSSWQAESITNPALLRAQFITPGETINYERLDRAAGGNTVFLYPKSGTTKSEFIIDLGSAPRYVDGNGEVLSGENDVERTVCAGGALPFGYHCQSIITMPQPVSVTASEKTILRITPIYNATSARITLWNGDTPVQFRGVQPLVDSTGRANDLFRRVEARLSVDAAVQYPEYALDLANALCKDFYVTDNSVARFGSGPQCRP